MLGFSVRLQCGEIRSGQDPNDRRGWRVVFCKLGLADVLHTKLPGGQREGFKPAGGGKKPFSLCGSSTVVNDWF